MAQFFAKAACWRRARLLALAGLALCGGLEASSAQTPARPRVAVLPFEINEASQDYFAGGLTDEIAGALTGVRGLDVVARSSAFRLPPQPRDARSIGKALNADYLVQGTTR